VSPAHRFQTVAGDTTFRGFLLLGANALDAGDLDWRLAAFLGDLGVLVGNCLLGRLVAIEAAKQLRGDAAVGALRAVHISDVEKGEFAFGIGTGFLGHAGLWTSARKESKPLHARHACHQQRVETARPAWSF
jgi:hypothetical protein